jgi:starch synthase
MTKDLKVLLIAEAANPEWTSVPLVGWSHCQALGTVADTHIVTQVRNAAAFERAGLVEGQQFTSLDSEAVARPIWRGTAAIRKLTGLGWTFETAVQSLSYYYFEHKLWQQFGDEIRAGKWDIVHRVTPLSPTTPSIIAGRCRRAGVPFVLGPLNGGVPWPPGFLKAQRTEGEWLHYVRDAYRLMPGYHGTYTHAAAIMAGSIATRGQLSRNASDRSIYLPENGVDAARFTAVRVRSIGSPLRVAFVGRLVAYKGADMLIDAAAELVRAGTVVLDIIGDGPERAGLTKQVDRLGIAAGVKIDGWVDQAALPDRLRQSDVFGFPSVREFGGAVVLEAMALGLVPVIADYAGPAEHVTSDTGYKVPMGSREDVVAGFRRVLEDLVSDPSGLTAMGRRARQRVLDFYTWSVKAEQVREVYDWVSGAGAKPDFGMPLASHEP